VSLETDGLRTHWRYALTVVGVFLVAGLREDVRLDALFAERVHTLETLGIAEVLEADLADEKLVVQLLRQADPAAAARQRSEVLLVFLVVAGDAGSLVRVAGRRG